MYLKFVANSYNTIDYQGSRKIQLDNKLISHRDNPSV